MAGFDVEKTRQTFEIPLHYEPASIAAVGYPGDPATLPEKLRDKQLNPQPRKALTDFIFESKWGQRSS